MNDLISKSALLEYFDSLKVRTDNPKMAELVEDLFEIFREGINNAPIIKGDNCG
jgi:hypothetical protein